MQLIARLLTQYGWPDNLNKAEYLQAVQTERAEYRIILREQNRSPPSSNMSLQSDISSHSSGPLDSPRASPTSDSVQRIEDWVLEGDGSQGEHIS
jgi:hypothetical protein